MRWNIFMKRLKSPLAFFLSFLDCHDLDNWELTQTYSWYRTSFSCIEDSQGFKCAVKLLYIDRKGIFTFLAHLKTKLYVAHDVKWVWYPWSNLKHFLNVIREKLSFRKVVAVSQCHCITDSIPLKHEYHDHMTENTVTQRSGWPVSHLQSSSSTLTPTVSLWQLGNRQDFSAVARKRIMEVVNSAHIRQRLLNQSEDSEDEGMSEVEEDTWVFPLVQMKPLGIRVDEQVTQVSLNTASDLYICS